MTLRSFCLLAVLATYASGALAQEETSRAPRKFGITHTFGFTASQPLGVSASAAVIIGSVPATRVKCAFSYWSKGAFLQVEPGLGGGKASLGYANSNGMFGMAAKGSALRTWGKTWGTATGATYIGPELELAMFGRLNIGWLWRTGSSRGKRSMFTWGVGIGF